MKNRWIFSTTCILLTVQTCLGQAKQSDVIERMKRAVVPIVCVGQRPDSSIYLISVEGTGFFASSNGDVVTAGHVAKGIFSDRIPVCAVQAIYVPVAGWNVANPDFPLRIITIKQCWWNDGFDIGVCKLTENPFTSKEVIIKPTIVELSDDILLDGTAITFTGFPLSFLQPITSQGTVGTYRAIAGDGIGPREIIMDKNAWPGASGSPIYAEHGKVYGMIVQRGFNDASGLAFGRTSAYITKFLADNKIARDKEQSEKKAEPSK